MAGTADEHLAKVRENLELLGLLEVISKPPVSHPRPLILRWLKWVLRPPLDTARNGTIGWSITILFYTALHYIEAYFVSQRGFGCKHHFSRASEIQRDSKLKSLYDHYSMLETLSREARYDVTSFTVQDLKRANDYFKAIKITIEAIL